MVKTDLSKFNNDWYQPGNPIKRLIWFVVNATFFKTSLLPISSIKRGILKMFGARIGAGVVIKPCVNIKYPWKLTVGENTWIGENVWIDNLDQVDIGANCCLSQGALLICGNHNYKLPSFDLMVSPIILEDGVWVGAKSVVTGGVTIGSHAVLKLGSVCSGDLEPYKIYSGSPAEYVRDRKMEQA